jgi:N-acetylglucosamine transport system substrate-binding protein
MAFLYSDKAAEIFAKSNAIQPITGITDKIEGETKAFYEIYNEEGVEALVGGFASTAPVEGVNIKETLFDSANSIISGDKTVEQWQEELNAASEKLSEAKE